MWKQLWKCKNRDLALHLWENCFLLNSERTEVIIFDPKNLRNMVFNLILSLDGFTLASSEIPVRNLGDLFEHDVSFNVDIKQIFNTAEMLVNVFISSRLDYCSSLISSSSKSSTKIPQITPNTAVKVLTGARKGGFISCKTSVLLFIDSLSNLQLSFSFPPLLNTCSQGIVWLLAIFYLI